MICCLDTIRGSPSEKHQNLSPFVMSIRTKKLASVIKRDLGEIIQRNYQPAGSLVTIISVRVTDDLSIAKVYLSVMVPGNDEESVFKLIDSHQDEIRYELASRIRHQVRRIPELLFFHDDTPEYVNKIETLFKKSKSGNTENDHGSAEEES